MYTLDLLLKALTCSRCLRSLCVEKRGTFMKPCTEITCNKVTHKSHICVYDHMVTAHSWRVTRCVHGSVCTHFVVFRKWSVNVVGVGVVGTRAARWGLGVILGQELISVCWWGQFGVRAIATFTNKEPVLIK